MSSEADTVSAVRPLDRSLALVQRARKVLPAGGTSTSRTESRPHQLRYATGEGSRLVDVDGNEYIDYELSHSTMLLGHRAPNVVRHVEDALRSGPLSAGHSENEIELAERVVRAIPSAEMVSFVSSGSEANNAAIGVARGMTGRRKILKFEGHYHGWVDPLPVSTYLNPPFDGTPAGVVGWPAGPDVLVCRWNDLNGFEHLMGEYLGEVAAVIMEPIALDCGILPIDLPFLRAVREHCTRSDVVLVFDELVSGFRVAPGGAQDYLGVFPDITAFGKAVASGFPIAGIAASAGLFERALAAGVRLLGTFNGHSIAVAAGIGALETLELEGDEIYPRLNALGARLAAGLRAAAEVVEAPVVVHDLGPVIALFWGVEPPVTTYSDTFLNDRRALPVLDEALTMRGVRTLRALRWYVSAAHSEADIDETVAIARSAFAACRDTLRAETL
jgi:glutamate-1-semialdehyde 2,1-aminomutase